MKWAATMNGIAQVVREIVCDELIFCWNECIKGRRSGATHSYFCFQITVFAKSRKQGYVLAHSTGLTAKAVHFGDTPNPGKVDGNLSWLCLRQYAPEEREMMGHIDECSENLLREWLRNSGWGWRLLWSILLRKIGVCSKKNCRAGKNAIWHGWTMNT